MLSAALAKDPEHSDIPAFRVSLEAREKQALAEYDKYRKLTRNRSSRSARNAALANAKKLWSDNPDFVGLKEPRAGLCTGRLAGLGKSRRSVCYDRLSKRKRGPVLVVIPAADGANLFAMTKFEVSVNEFNQYCRATKKCKSSRKGRNNPRTDIPVSSARAYAKWLSAVTSKVEGESIVYRLPTAAEWHLAATAKGKQPPKQGFNCRVSSGGTLIKGHTLVSATNGKSNQWGLVNYVGNAQEWVQLVIGWRPAGVRTPMSWPAVI